MLSPYVLHSKISIPYYWQAGNFLGRFFAGLSKGILLASICPKCQLKSLPPRQICIHCSLESDALIEVQNAGRLRTFTHLNLDSAQKYRCKDECTFYSNLSSPVWGIVQFDTCDTGLVHFINPGAIKKLSVGTRMKAVFKPVSERVGTILDIHYFDLDP